MKWWLIQSICILVFAPVVVADDFAAGRNDNWHHWRGPLASGVAPRGDPPIRWDEKTNVRWKIEVPGESHATPIVWGNQIFLLSAVETDRTAAAAPEADSRAKTEPPRNYYQFIVTCVARNSGKVLWKRVACEEVPHEGRHSTNTYASGSPTTDGSRLYASFGSRGIFCYDLRGNLLWQRDLGDMQTRFGWGEAVSPVVHEQSLVVNWDHEGQSFITALDAASGQTRWKVLRDEASSWATPLVVEHEGGVQVIVNGTNRVRSYDLATGQLIWECGGQTVNAIPSPVRCGDAAVCMSGYRGAAAFAMPLSAQGDITDTHQVRWHHDRGTPYVPSPVAVGEQIYFTRHNSAVLSCLNVATGAPVFEQERLPGLSNLYASPVAASGRIYFVGRDGTTTVIRHGLQLDVLAVNQLDDPIDASPAIVGRQMILRGSKYLYCISEGET